MFKVILNGLFYCMEVYFLFCLFENDIDNNNALKIMKIHNPI